MSRSVPRGQAARPRETKVSDFFLQLQQHLQDINTFVSRVVAEVNRAAHSEDADLVILVKECDTCLIEFKKLAERTLRLKDPVEQKIATLKLRAPSHFHGPIQAAHLQTVITLHLTGDQSFSKRLEQLQEIERNRVDALGVLTSWRETSKERFNEITARLNLLCYMRDCLKKDGFLPRNIMYNSNITQTVLSPFAEPPPRPQPSKVVPLHARLSGEPLQFTKEEIQRNVEKRKGYLLQAKKEAMQKEEPMLNKDKHE